MVDIVNGLLIRDGQVLMALRAANRRNYPATWSFPGGHVEAGETLQEALARELCEEIGVVPTTVSLLTRLSDLAGEAPSEITFHMFAVTAWDGEPANLGTEHEKLSWFSFEEAQRLPNLALEGYPNMLGKL